VRSPETALWTPLALPCTLNWPSATLSHHAALLSALARLVPAAAPGELVFAARLATADLAALLTGATEPAAPTGSPA
jgi:hypothetical protein